MNALSKPGLDPIEHASRDEIRALQLQRLKWALAHAYQNGPHYKKAFDDAGVALLGVSFALLNYAFDEISNPALRPVRRRRARTAS